MRIGSVAGLFVLLALLAGCAMGTPPRTYGETKHSAPLAAQDRIAVGFAPGYVTAPSTNNPAAQSALAACVLAPLRERFPDVAFTGTELLQRDLDASEPAIQRELHWQRRLADQSFIDALTGLGFRYVIELQDQSSDARHLYATPVAFGGWAQGTQHLYFLRLQATVLDLEQHRVVAAWNGAAEGEGKTVVAIGVVFPSFVYIPPCETDAGFICGDLAKAVSGIFTPQAP